ncbi:hypothetical protein [Clostridium beijerinckii]|uniref:Neutral ceramidase superfamily lipid hydrolase n=1 Tax=Clostridium beijerinckii TaxID=1520 RepID=A0A0B5Q449_CLOBE|nr:hypothetical protein [Clostridium beijerinckii]AJG96974.1 hypothetical protein LF65_00300 [Clostridium beijerinckii]AQS02914.1 hypothetical protein CLBIJ_02930 [Clostridium beijerinckii]MBA2886351.1 putative neutral ceramidase superfamily lipid hydrolase [Clostridium beijerinckii]MBA2901085.1 putative neutral ceramidase superfamily lipid hydrolase [Clostridium beijerinckii]MBA2910910.1 putative neutral ceramidase superfamily lipid hydrolase [Clostridium beijerinckii]
MSIYLKKALLDIKSIFLFLFIFAVLIYNFSIGTTANYSNFDIYDIGVGFFSRIGAIMLAYLLLLSILIDYYDKDYIIIRFQTIEKWRLSIIKNQIFLAIIFTLILNVIPVIYIVLNSSVIKYDNWKMYLAINTITQAAAFMSVGFFATLVYFKTLNLKFAITIPFIVYSILNLIDNFLLNQYLNISASFSIPCGSNDFIIYEVCRKTLIIALIFYIISTSIKKKRDMFDFEG